MKIENLTILDNIFPVLQAGMTKMIV